MQTLQRNQQAWIFAEPVNAESLNIPDYYTIVKNPMDFGTITTKLKEMRYNNITELVFSNCRLYNGDISSVGQMGKQVSDEYEKLCE